MYIYIYILDDNVTDKKRRGLLFGNIEVSIGSNSHVALVDTNYQLVK